MPQPGTYVNGQKVTIADARDDRVILNVTQLNAAAQTISTRQVVLSEHGIALVPIHVRYGWPSELDLMARLAGLRLLERWSEWDGKHFNDGDPRHISVYGR